MQSCKSVGMDIITDVSSLLSSRRPQICTAQDCFSTQRLVKTLRANSILLIHHLSLKKRTESKEGAAFCKPHQNVEEAHTQGKVLLMLLAASHVENYSLSN